MGDSLKISKWLIALVFIISSSTVFAAIIENQGEFHQRLKLFTGSDDDPYTMYYPIEVTQPRRVNIRIKITNYDFERVFKKEGKPFRMLLVDSRFFTGKEPMKPSEFQQVIQKVNQYNPVEYMAGDWIRSTVSTVKNGVKSILGIRKKKKSPPDHLHIFAEAFEYADYPDNRRIPWVHDVDQDELGKTQGMYFIVLQNSSRYFTPELEVTASFPGTQQSIDPEFLRPSDIGISQMTRTDDNKIMVTIKNYGQNDLPESLYARKGANAISLMLQFNGKSWGGATLQGLDPNHELAKAGGEVSYLFDPKLTRSTEVTATLNMPDFKDSNERNNVKNFTFDPQSAPLRPIYQLR